MEKTKCIQAIEYKCPHTDNCRSNSGSLHSCGLTPSGIWYLSSMLTKNHKIWYSNERLNSCLPMGSSEEITFYKESLETEIASFKKNLERIKQDMNTNLERIIKN